MLVTDIQSTVKHFFLSFTVERMPKPDIFTNWTISVGEEQKNRNLKVGFFIGKNELQWEILFLESARMQYKHTQLKKLCLHDKWSSVRHTRPGRNHYNPWLISTLYSIITAASRNIDWSLQIRRRFVLLLHTWSSITNRGEYCSTFLKSQSELCTLICIWMTHASASRLCVGGCVRISVCVVYLKNRKGGQQNGSTWSIKLSNLIGLKHIFLKGQLSLNKNFEMI